MVEDPRFPHLFTQSALFQTVSKGDVPNSFGKLRCFSLPDFCCPKLASAGPRGRVCSHHAAGHNQPAVPQFDEQPQQQVTVRCVQGLTSIRLTSTKPRFTVHLQLRMLYVEVIPADHQQAASFVQFCWVKNSSFSYRGSSEVIALQTQCFQDKVTGF